MIRGIPARPWGLAVLLCCWAGSVAAQTTTSTNTPVNTDAAKDFADAGRTYYQAGDYLKALEAFQKAHELAGTPALKYNIARCHERLSQWQDAVTWYEQYAQATTDARDKAETLEKIELLKKKLGPDTASPEAQFEARMQAGRGAYSKGDYEGAIEEFKAAFDLKANSSALYNIAKSYEKLGRCEDAIEFYRQYLDLDPNASDRANVEELIRQNQKCIEGRFQELTVNSDPTGADIYLDDRNTGLMGQTNFRFKIKPGPHTLYIDLNGYEPIKRDFVMPDDKPLALDFKMKKLENVGYLEIKVSKDGARIFVDGAIVGLSPYKQKKALEQGKHQVQVEMIGHPRWVGDFDITREQTTVVDVQLEEYDAPVADTTLSAWGRNLMIIGLIGGGLGVGGPFVYQKLVVRRPYFDALGPGPDATNPYYTGPGGTNNPENGELKTMRTVQLVSLISGGVLTAAGLGFYIYKWVRTVPPPPVTAQNPQDRPVFTIEGFGIAPTENGAAFGLSGSF